MAIALVLSVSRFEVYWKQRSKQTTSKDALVYVALGDSAAQGVGATSANNGYVGQFAERLHADSGREVHVINLSKSGARVSDVIRDQLPTLAALKPDVVTLDIGGNDIKGFNGTTFRKEMGELMVKLPPGTLVADIPYFGGRAQLPFFGSGGPEKDVATANTIIHELAKDQKIIIVPVHEATRMHNGRRVWNYAVDYFHPSNQGYKAWTNAFWKSYQER